MELNYPEYDDERSSYVFNRSQLDDGVVMEVESSNTNMATSSEDARVRDFGTSRHA